MSEESIVTHLFSTHFVHGTWYEEGLRTQGHVRSMAGEKINMGWSDEGNESLRYRSRIIL